MDEILGDYEFINHGLEAETTYSTMLPTYNVTLNADGTITGDYKGTWSQGNGNYYCTMEIDNVTYKGVFFKQLAESEEHNETMTFSLIGDNNESIWGSKVELTDEMLVKYEEKNLEKVIPSQTKVDINLPTEGKNDIKITWKSNNEEVLSSTGKVTRSEENTEVILTATLTKGEVTRTKDFKVIVKGNAVDVTVEPIYKYDFESVEDKLVANSGSNEGSATLIGDATVSKDETRGNVLEIINEKGALKANYLALPNNTFESITEEGYTVSMWVNVDKDDPNYFEYSALFEASMTKENGTPTYPITRISANLFGRINANGAWSDVTSISNPLESNKWEYVTYTVNPDGIVVYVNGDEVGRDNKDISVCFKDNFLALMTDVKVGSGNIWGDMDIANAKFDNITVFNTALSDKEVEGLYN
ncbi:MAG: glycoside hydrolase family 43 C-terminal domain-containing protein [Clostridium celatum]|nr:glycoside hydrolase family 43 C-terminal domain-containing protein [Clostridium celatum]